jgi:hypothetical protein
MDYVKVWIGDDHEDVQAIVRSIERGERSAWIRDAIREKAGREPRENVSRLSETAIDLSPIVAELRRIGDRLAGGAIDVRESASPESEDAEAANRLDQMF